MEASIPGLPTHALVDQTFTQVFLTESLLSHALTTEIHIQDVTMTSPVKIYDDYKGKNFILSAKNPNLPNTQLDVYNTIYRMEKRTPMNRATESYKLQATHVTLLTNQQKRIHKFYTKQTPSAIVADALSQVSSTVTDVEPTNPIRDYSAKNVHPFEVIYDQANYALSSNGNDPSLLHYMTYENLGTHFFRSIKTLTQQPVIAKYTYEDKGAGYHLSHSYNIMSYEFPCEFDLLSDIMNGVGAPATSIGVNPIRSLWNSSTNSLGGNLSGSTFTNQGTEDHSATTQFGEAQRYRAARLALLRPDRISLRITVPFNPSLHAGKMIKIVLPSSYGLEEFGTGDYLIVSMTHNLRLAGYGVTALDCVSRTVGDGVV
jgi:hypothetical protein